MWPYGERTTNEQASNKQRTTTSMADWSLYPDATQPTAPRFEVGDIVYLPVKAWHDRLSRNIRVIIDGNKEGTMVLDDATIATASTNVNGKVSVTQTKRR